MKEHYFQCSSAGRIVHPTSLLDEIYIDNKNRNQDDHGTFIGTLISLNVR